MRKKIFGYLLYGLALFLTLFYIINAIRPNISIDFKTTMMFIVITCLLIYFRGVLLFKYYKNDKPLKTNLWIFFVLYLLLFINLTLFDSSWGRHGLFGSFNLEYLKESINLIPFRTIYEFLIENFNNLTDSATIFYNILGNFVALMPMAFFLPLLFKKENKFKTFFLTILLITLGIELLQLFGGVGRFDIDDIILNVGGSLIMFKILKIKTIDDLVKNIFLLEKNKIDKKKLIKLICLFGLIFIAILGVIIFHNYLYKENLSVFQYQMKIVDESTSCIEGLDKFYENEFYTYYFPCQKSDKVYAVINDRDKYLVKDLLNHNTSKYEVDIKRIQRNLDFYKVEYSKEFKYSHITFSTTMPTIDNTIYSPRIEINNSDDTIIEAKLDYDNAIMESSNYVIYLHLIPKKMGTTTIEVSAFDSKNQELLNQRKYKVIVSEDLKVQYEKED